MIQRLPNRVVLTVLACLLGCGVACGQGDPKAVELTPPKREYAQEYPQPFKGKTDNIQGWEAIGPGADQNVRFEADGLRITLPSGWGGDRPSTGLRSRFGVKGDFEITLTFEILKEPEKADAGGIAGTRLNLGIIKDVPKGDVSTLGRAALTNGPRFVAWSNLGKDVAGKKDQPISRPTTATTGRLRLVRSGADLYYGSSEGFDGDFSYFKKFPFGAEDLLQVRIIGATGSEKSSLDARVTDFRIRADSIPNMPAVAPVPAVASGPGTAVPQADAQAAPAGRPWLMAALLIGAVLVLVFAVAMAAGFLLLRRRAIPAPAAKQNVTDKRQK